jgi:hypothetical protein
MKPIIIDLCGGTGAWSRPWLESGEYDVRVITLPDHDVRTYQPPENVYGILAAPPCTAFSPMQNYNGSPSKELIARGIEVLEACMKIIWKCQPKFWALENPGRGSMSRWMGGLPRLTFHPWEYGDPWTKHTSVWGYFNVPMKLFPKKPRGPWVAPHDGKEVSREYFGYSKATRSERRSITPPGFARAFFEANRIPVNKGVPGKPLEIRA